ncbi:unnamed protein product, partial [marine sediment metagenome]
MSGDDRNGGYWYVHVERIDPGDEETYTWRAGGTVSLGGYITAVVAPTAHATLHGTITDTGG